MAHTEKCRGCMHENACDYINCRFDEIKNICNQVVSKLRIKVEQLMEDLENETQNRHMNDLEQGRYNALNEVLEIMDKI